MPTTNTQYRTDYQRGIFFGFIFVSYFVSFLSKKGLNCALKYDQPKPAGYTHCASIAHHSIVGALCLCRYKVRKPEDMGETVLIVIGVLLVAVAVVALGWLVGQMFKHQ